MRTFPENNTGFAMVEHMLPCIRTQDFETLVSARREWRREHFVRARASSQACDSARTRLRNSRSRLGPWGLQAERENMSSPSCAPRYTLGLLRTPASPLKTPEPPQHPLQDLACTRACRAPARPSAPPPVAPCGMALQAARQPWGQGYREI